MTDRSSETAERVLLEAAALFREKGFASASTRELADRLGMRGASLYYHFKNKEDLLYRVCVRSMTTVRTRVDEVLDPRLPVRERLRAMVGRHVITLLEQRDLHTPMLTQLAELTPVWRDDILRRRREYEQLFTDQIVLGQREGVIRTDLTAELLTLSLFNLLNWTVFWYNPEKDQTPQELADMFVSVFFDGAGSAPS
ncbi:TetR/AcrR family transcriptional regulator [Rhodococcus olei]|uniref:TetR/AcrR family transcriptional regulator n=1 Tax=Rhodococcus olei TaxID=2161675 RepID=A0ABP8PSW2_9NOCA